MDVNMTHGTQWYKLLGTTDETDETCEASQSMEPFDNSESGSSVENHTKNWVSVALFLLFITFNFFIAPLPW